MGLTMSTDTYHGDTTEIDGIWVVYYDSSIRFASRDLSKADEAKKAFLKEWPALPWKCTSIADYGWDCYTRGIEAGEESCD